MRRLATLPVLPPVFSCAGRRTFVGSKMKINARMPEPKSAVVENDYATPTVLGVHLVNDSTDRVIAWTMPNGSPFYCRVFKSVDSRRLWQVIVQCEGFHADGNGKNPQAAADVASDRIRAIARKLRGVVES